MKNKSKLQSTREKRYARYCEQAKELSRKLKKKLEQIDKLEEEMNG